MAKDPEQLAHQEWLGYVQPVGLVVSIPALLAAQAHINRNIVPDHQRFLDCLPRDAHDELIPELRDFAEFTQQVLGWRAGDLEVIPPGDAHYASIEVPLPEYSETLRPTHVVRELEPKDPQHPWMMLIQLLPTGTPFDDAPESKDRTWHAPPQARFERLLRETRVPIGLLCNAKQIRIVYAPRGETSGFATFSVSEMAQVAGRPIFAALHMLLCEERLFSLGEKQRLPAILGDSRKYQNVVSTQLAEQVLAALYELVRGFQAADDQSKGELLGEVLAENPNHVYQGLLTVLMRLVFVLYAEDRGLLSSDPIFANFYSITGLFEKLRADDGRYPDTMDQRYGAWAQFLTLFRLIYEGGSHGEFKIPPRHGYLFDPDRYNFLEGRPWKIARAHHEGDVHVPRISDGVIFRVLNNLLILDGERLSYRTLDVEQIGSVYETMMGFDLEVAQGRSIALKPKKPHGAPTTINLEALLAVKGADRAKWLKEKAEQDLTGQALDTLKKATTLEELLASLEKKIAKLVTPNVVSKGAIVLQPSDERRKSGSHYTPRSHTEPIVETTLRPIMERLGLNPTPEQILDLKICDLAMGSGAFLVAVCRFLAELLVRAWHVHKCPPKLPPDEDELLHARRLVAQRCLYGVDKNPMAVDLSKLSLWLATLAKDHPFTFLDHSLRSGDSLVGLSRDQISGFHWSEEEIGKRNREDEPRLIRDPIADRIRRATEYRQKILAARDDNPYDDLQQKLAVADEALALARLAGDLVISAYFTSDKDKARIARLNDLGRKLVQYVEKKDISLHAPLHEAVRELGTGPRGIRPFHWQIEFPEIFTVDAKGKPTGGFDAIVGNPPFLGGNQISTHYGMPYFSWLSTAFSDTGGICDLVAYFFRRAFAALRIDGTFGLIATKTVAEGETRIGGLKWIREHSGSIYSVRKRLSWPGAAAVIVSVLHVKNGAWNSKAILNGTSVTAITSYLFDKGGDGEPAPLAGQNDLFSQGTNPRSPGFIFCDDDLECTPIASLDHIRQVSPNEAKRIFPYLGGEEINQSPTQSHHRFIIFLDDIETEQELMHFPRLAQIVREKVKPGREELGDNPNNIKLRRRWWAYHAARHDFYSRIRLSRATLVNTQVGNNVIFAMQPTDRVFALTLNVYNLHSFAAFCVLQSRPHEVWARFFGSHMKDDLRYTPSTCFETFPFPLGVLEHAAGETANTNKVPATTLETAGRQYYEFRAALMVRNNEGLTKTYNRLHDPDERAPDVLELRRLHADMDRAVLDAYGWHDLSKTATCEFLLDYEDEDDEDDAPSSGRQKKKPWRYRWPDDFRDEVLARLLELNKQRAEQERLTGIAAGAKQTGSKKGAGTKSKKSKTKANETANWFDSLDSGGNR
jgi:hypothetical protein